MIIKKNTKIIIIYLNKEDKIFSVIGKIIKIKKNTFKIKKKSLNVIVYLTFFIKNPNIISIKKI